jgi:hypothetical protein
MTQTQMQEQMPVWGTSLLRRLFPTLMQQKILEEANSRLFQTCLEKEDPLRMPTQTIKEESK